MDCIKIQDLEIYGHHGVFREENVLGQKFLVSLILYMDTSEAGKTDNLLASVDYAEISHRVKTEVEKKEYKLIEAVAEHLAEVILQDYTQIKRVCVEIKKPWAPILLPLDTVSVCIERGWHTAYLSIGSNMGDRRKHLQKAVESLEKSHRIRNVRVSEFIETKPYGYTDQEDFLNAVVELSTMETPEGLLRLLQKIEAEDDRERTVHWGPRTIDLDLILYEDVILSTQDLTIPHREMHKREFVLDPLCRIAPWVMHPVYKKTAEELLMSLKRE